MKIQDEGDMVGRKKATESESRVEHVKKTIEGYSP